jgi:hypothetical protein
MVNFGSLIFPMGFAGNHLRWLIFMHDGFPNPFGSQQRQDKLDFVASEIYGPERTWSSWLLIERKFRSQLDPFLEIKHDCYDWESFPDRKELYLSADDYEKVFQHYYHVNLGLNNQTPDVLLAQNLAYVNEFEFIKKRISEFPHKKIIKCDVLFEPVLPADFYQELVDFYDLVPDYDAVNQVQKLYWNARQKSLKDFYDHFTSLDFANTLQSIKASIVDNK